MNDPLELLDQYYDGTLTPEGLEELQNYIKDDPEIARKIVLAMHTHTNIVEMLSGRGDLRDLAIQKIPNSPELPNPLSEHFRSSLQRSTNSPPIPLSLRRSLWHSHHLRIAALILIVASISLA